MSSGSKSELKALVEIISQNVDALDAALAAKGAAVPSLDEPFVPGSDICNGQPDLMAKADLACRAALQLAAVIRMPQLTLFQDAISHVVCAALRCVTELHVAEVLKEAGPQGLHVHAIAKICKVESKRLASILRCLASRWIFKEVSPDVFANNRVSSLLDKGVSVKELQTFPDKAFDKPQAALCAAIGHFSDEHFKSSAFLYDVLTDPNLGTSEEVKDAAFGKAFNTTKSYWEYGEQPDQKSRAMAKRFGIAMQGTLAFEPKGLSVAGFQWDTLPEGSMVVDVGGGVGAVTSEVAEAFPKLKFVIQDLPSVVEEGRKRFKENNLPGQVTFEVHDFFKPNPIKNPAVFLLKYITHDWSDSNVKKILSHLRAAAGQNTRLAIIDRIVPYTCALTEDHVGTKIQGVIQAQFPSPVTLAYPDDTVYKATLMMTSVLNGQERTFKHIFDLFASAGWKIERVVQFESNGALPSCIWSVPA